MEQRKIDELRKRHAKIVFKAGIPFKVFDDEDLNNDQMSEMMDWCDEADEEGLLPIEVEQISEERRRYLDAWYAACAEFAAIHPERVAEIQNARNGKEGLALEAQMHIDASAYADEVCKKKGLK